MRLTPLAKMFIGAAIGGVIVVGLLMYFIGGKIHGALPDSYNYLKSAVFDLDNRTKDNETILKVECDGYQAKAAEYLKIDRSDVRKLVEKYTTGCESLAKSN